MASPTPPASIDGACSVIHKDTLYVYSSEAFQSLPLKDGADWSQLKSGVSVTGATCVKAGDDALWVVGGTSKNSDYAGLQRYSFADASWESIVPVDNVLKDRQGHSTAYLSDSGMILVYAGSRDDPKQLSQETFTISTQKPYNILSSAGKTPPVVHPILLPWNATSAITLGGNDNIKDIYIFTPGFGTWKKYPTALSQVPKDSTLERATLVQGTDGSKVLELYDMSVSPNVVTGILLQNSRGQPAITGRIVGPALTNDSKRDLAIGEWPPYNSSAAPTYTRSGFDIAQGDDGLVAITGGNADHPVALFNEQKNSWVDSSQFFGINGNDQSVFSPSSAMASPTPTPTASSTPTPPPIDANPHKTSVILGATLGSILGFIAILIIVLLCLRRRSKQKAAAAAAAADSGEKPRLSFADRGAPFMMEAGGAANANNNNVSVYDPHSSMAIMGGMANHKRGMESRGSESSTARLVPGRKSGPGMPDAMEMATIREKNDSASDPPRLQAGNTNGGLMPPKRSSGWSRYFSGNTEVLASARASKSSLRKSDGLRKSALSRKSTRSSMTSSHYAQSVHDCKTHGPTEIPPLKFGDEFESARVNDEVTSLPPTTPAKSSMSKTRPTTMDSELSSNPPSTLDDTIFAYDTSPANESNRWTPVNTTNPRSQWSRDWSPAVGSRQRDTATSSIYGPTAVAGEARDPTIGPRQSALYNARQGVGAAPAVQAPAPAVTLSPAVYTTPSGAGGGFFTAPVGSAVYPSSRPPTTRTDTSDAHLDARALGPVFGESNQPRGYDAPAGVGTDITSLAYTEPGATAPAAGNQPQREVKVPNYQTTPAPYRSSTVQASRKSIGGAAKPEEPAKSTTTHGLVAGADLPIQEVAKTSAVSTPEVKHEGPPGSWPTPPQRASIVDMDDLDDSSDDEGDVVIATANSGPAPTAMTAIPVPGSTAMKYTVKKPTQKPAGSSDMGWLNLRG